MFEVSQEAVVHFYLGYASEQEKERQRVLLSTSIRMLVPGQECRLAPACWSDLNEVKVLVLPRGSWVLRPDEAGTIWANIRQAMQRGGMRVWTFDPRSCELTPYVIPSD